MQEDIQSILPPRQTKSHYPKIEVRGTPDEDLHYTLLSKEGQITKARERKGDARSALYSEADTTVYEQMQRERREMGYFL